MDIVTLNPIPIALFVVAAIMALYDRSGWGWFLFVGVLLWRF